jgi:NarL family two-component system response regulator LiaR
MTDQAIKVMIVDDHSLVRNGIKYTLQTFKDMTLVSEAGGGAEALALCRETLPDVVLMDLILEDMDGISVTKTIRQELPSTQVIVLTSYHNKTLVEAAIQAGAAGYLLKSISAQELAQAIRAAHDGSSKYTSTYDDKVIELIFQASTQPNTASIQFSQRQEDILKLIARGCTNTQIAKRLCISAHTVRYHTSVIYERLCVANRAEAVAFAIQHGLVDISE